MQGGMMGGDQMLTGWGGMIFGPFSMLVILGLFVVLIVLLVRWLSGDNASRTGSGDSALTLLKERFARGEIDKGEFEDRKNQLQG